MALDRTRPWGHAPPGTGPDTVRELPAPPFAQRTLLFVVASYVFVGVLNIRVDNPGDGWANAGSFICLAFVFVLQAVHIRRDAPLWPPWLKATTLTAQAVATYLPFVAFHELWGGMAGFLAGSLVLLLRKPFNWVLFALCTLSMMVVALLTHESPPWVAYFAVATSNLGLFVYAVARLTDLVAALHSARSELARMAVAQERLRFSRDLHDLLGYSLSAITLKTELAYRLAGGNGQPEKVRQELTSILEISRQALSDLRTVASSYRNMRLSDELSSVRSMLLAAEIDVSLDVCLPDLPPQLDTVLATTLREGVTNVLRHSKVQRCAIAAWVADGTVHLQLVNDGITAGSAETGDGAGSSGLGSLGQRLAAVGGRLNAGADADGRFRLDAEAPLLETGCEWRGGAKP